MYLPVYRVLRIDLVGANEKLPAVLQKVLLRLGTLGRNVFGAPFHMDHHQRELRRAAAKAFIESLDQLAICFQPEEATSEQSDVNEQTDQAGLQALDAVGKPPIQRKIQE